MKKAFTLIEVNLAMLVMAGGILSLVGLYAFGFRENTQSTDDVVAAVVGESVVSQIAMALGRTNMTWSAFNGISTPCMPTDGWMAYVDEDGKSNGKGPESFYSKIGITKNPTVPSGYTVGVVLTHTEDSPVVGVAVRVVKDKGDLMSMPLFYTAVRFQGVAEVSP